MSDEIDVKAITDRLKMAKQLEKDCLKQLTDEEPDMDGVYRDAQDDLWVLFCGNWKKLYHYGDGKFGLGDNWRWKNIVENGAEKGILPFRFITPIKEG